jgi:hypothetical protein
MSHGMVTLAIALTLAVARGLCAPDPAAVLQQLKVGARVSVASSFSKEAILQFAQAGTNRVVVDCRGIDFTFAPRYFAAGAQVMVDRGVSPPEVLKMVQLDGPRVWVFGARFDQQDLIGFSKKRATIVAVGGSFSFAQLQDILAAGGSLVLDVTVPGPDVTRLASLGQQRVTVYCSGFTAPVIRQFLNAGARVVVDSSLILPDVTQICSAGGSRVIVVTTGFGVVDAQRFAQSGSQIITDISLGIDGVGRLADAIRERVTVRAQNMPVPDLTRFAAARVHIDYSTGRASAIRVRFGALYGNGGTAGSVEEHLAAIISVVSQNPH